MKENEVIDNMQSWLEKEQGYNIISIKEGTQKGNDIEAKKENKVLYVECKGSRPNKGGNEFGNGVKFTSAAYALFNQIKLREQNKSEDIEVGIAFPENKNYHDVIMNGLKSFCNTNRIRIFWVSENGQVREW